MKRTLITTILASSALMMAACGGKKDYSTMTNAEKIVGTWTVDVVDMTEAGMEMSMKDVKQTYKDDNTFTMSASMTVSGAGLPGNIGMNVDGAGTYSVEGDTLISTVTDVDGEITELPDGMEAMKDMMSEQMSAGLKDQKTTQAIVVLDATTLTLEDEATGITISLGRQ